MDFVGNLTELRNFTLLDFNGNAQVNTAAFSKLTKLVHVEFGTPSNGDPWSSVHGSILDFTQMRQLRHLSTPYGAAAGNSTIYLDVFANMPELHYLDVRYSYFHGSLDLLQNKKLTYLNIDGNYIGAPQSWTPLKPVLSHMTYCNLGYSMCTLRPEDTPAWVTQNCVIEHAGQCCRWGCTTVKDCSSSCSACRDTGFGVKQCV